MKEKTIHVVSGLSVRGTLKHAFSKMGVTDEIIYLPVAFSFFYIPKDFTDKELCFSALSNCNPYFDSQCLYEELRKFIDKDFTQYDKVIVWHGWEADDLLLLYFMSVLVESNLYHVDIRECKELVKKQSPSMRRSYFGLGWVSPYDITSFNLYSYAKSLSEEEKEHNKKQWYRWANSSSPYRISSFSDGIIREYPVDFMDEVILDCAKKESQIRVIVAYVMGRFSDIQLHDTYISRRILELYWEGKLTISVTPCLEESANTENQ